MDDSPAVFTSARSNIDQPVGGPDCFLVVFHHDERVAQIPQLHEGVNQSSVVALVQTNTGLIEDIEHSGEPGPDLGSESDALCFPTAEASCRARKREVPKTHFEEEVEPRGNFSQNRSRDLRVTF